ncbi:molybdopterin oxidoreductase family protein [Dermatobacter hominis]|uniref:molybdopterin oxidoreductase family protein n=1 Tax=Dermatobacter hominis TaxID=2884263 RepID=UPI001D11CF7C|nr:molybdopterin-dependent oxidoreductase [Dermatobacter hominis]UDY35155.1 molybdopterin-dependent oxidoreductase [Dermatobacter hominis]
MPAALDGVVRQVPAARAPERVVRSVCGFCSTGCSLDVHQRDRRAVNVVPTRGHPVNDGSACPKGWEALTPMVAPDRATRPLVRRGGRMVPVDWGVAFETFAERVKAVQSAHGPDSVAFLSTGQIVTEEMAFLGALAKFGMGLVHGDGNTRQCMATSVAAYKECFGFDAPPYAYDDLERSDVVVLVGSNLAIAHPILFERLQRNPHAPEVIVVDPRTTETAMAATLHLAARPKTDQVLLYGIARALIERGAVDHAFVSEHTSGFERFAAAIGRYDPARVCAETGLDDADLHRAVDAIAAGERVSFWWTMGVNQGHAATRTAQAIIALALMTGNIGRPGTGANSITGQCNAMGSRLFSNTASLFAGRDTTDPGHRQEVADVLGIDVGAIGDRPSLAYDQIVDGIEDGSIRGLWIVATNPVHSWIDRRRLGRLLDRLDVLVVQDLYADTETARRADVFLPAAGWAEKEGTFINSERRIGRVRPAHRPPGQARTDFEIFQGIAEFWGCGPMFRRWRSPAAVFDLLAELSRGRPCDITGIGGHAGIGDDGVQWPWTEADAAAAPDGPPLERRLFADGRFHTPDGRARFIHDEPSPPHDATSDDLPLILLTGRGTSAQWHTQTRTGRSPTLAALAPARLHLEMSPHDARQRGLRSGQDVTVRSRRGALTAAVFVTPTLQPGQVFLPMHDPAVNALTAPGFDPWSRQPAYKHTAVEVVAAPG